MNFFAHCLLGFVSLTFANLAKSEWVLTPVVLPSAQGRIIAVAFSPDNSQIALFRHLAGPDISGIRNSIEIVDLKTGHEVAHADVLERERPGLASSPHFAKYSPDGHNLLLVTEGSDSVLIIDVPTLQIKNRIALHPESGSRTALSGQAPRYFRGVVSLGVASDADRFGLLTHDEMRGNEIFVGSFSSGKIINRWSLGRGRTSTQLGQSALSLSNDGKQAAVSLLPSGNGLPKNFKNLRLYNSDSGELLKNIRTDGLIGQLMLVPGQSVLAARIDTPGFFSKTMCIEKWSLATGTLAQRFCDPGRNVVVALGSSAAAEILVGFAAQIHKDVEGQVSAASGRVDVWNTTSGNVITHSEEIPLLVPYIQVSPNGSWVMADQTLWQVSAGQ